MSDTNNTPLEGQQTEPQGTQAEPTQGGSTYTPPATQADLDRIVENRLQRERQKYSDYDQLKAQAEQMQGLVAERDSLRSQLETANSELSTYKANDQRRQWAVEVAQETGVPADVLRGDSKEDMLAHASSLKSYLMPSAPRVGSDGRQPQNQAKPTLQQSFAEALSKLS